MSITIRAFNMITERTPLRSITRVNIDKVKKLTSDLRKRGCVFNAWKRFIDSGFKEGNFTEMLYKHLHLHCSFIAHYNRKGFYDAFFPAGNHGLETFLVHFDPQHRHFNHPSSYTDLNTAMAEYLAPRLAKIRQESDEIIKNANAAINILNRAGTAQINAWGEAVHQCPSTNQEASSVRAR